MNYSYFYTLEIAKLFNICNKQFILVLILIGNSPIALPECQMGNKSNQMDTHILDNILALNKWR